MHSPEPASREERKQSSTLAAAVLGVLMVPVAVVGAALVIPIHFATRWTRQHGEHKLRLLMKSRGRLINWQEFLRRMREEGGTCIEERFSPRGPVRFWWTPENVGHESPYAIIDWFTMRKGRGAEPFIRWCRERYTSADSGSAVLVDAPLVPRREIYTVWTECRSETSKARWVEIAPPEIVPHRPGA
jgi:hypothetical protein